VETEKVEFELISNRARLYRSKDDEVIFTIWRSEENRLVGDQYSVSCIVLPAAGLSEYPIYLSPTTVPARCFDEALEVAKIMLAETIAVATTNLVAEMLAAALDRIDMDE